MAGIDATSHCRLECATPLAVSCKSVDASKQALDRLSFASSHGIHLALILAMSLDFPDPFLSEQPLGKWLFGESPGLGFPEGDG